MIQDTDVVVGGSGGFGAPAIGEQLSQWIVDGQPTEDLGGMSITRFGPEWRDERRLREAAAWEYWHFYSYHAREV